MTVTTDRAERTATSAVLPTDGAISVARPLPARDVAILGGLWADRVRTNRERTLPHGYAQLGHAGNLHELPPRGRARRARTRRSGRRWASSSRSSTPTSTSGSRRSAGSSAAARTPSSRAAADEAIGLVAAAQRPDGYLNTLRPGRRRRARRTATCRGATSSTASATSSRPRIAWHRALGDDRLLDDRAPRRRPRSRPSSGRAAATASTGTPRSRWPSSSCTGRPATGATSSWPRGWSTCAATACSARAGSAPAYWQDHAPVREAADGGRPRRPPAVPRLRRGRRRRRARRRRPAGRRPAALARHGRDPDLPDRRRSAAGTATRRSATRTSCRPTGPTPRPARRSRA